MHLPQAVLFDLDGTLLDSEHLWLLAEQQTMQRWNVDWTPQDQEYCLGGPLERVAQYMQSRIESQRDSHVPSLAELSSTLLSHVHSLFLAEPIAWRPGARSLVEDAHARGIPTAIVTASWRLLLDAVMSNMRSHVGEFTVSIAGDEVLHSKPDPFPYLEAARLLNVPIVQCLAIEDSPTGTESAVSAGARTISVQHMTNIAVPGAITISTLEGHTVESLWSVDSLQY